MSKRVITATFLLIALALVTACGPGVAGDSPTTPNAAPAASPVASPAASSTTDARPDANQQDSQTQRKPEPSQRSEQMRCAPESLRRGDALTVELPAPHGGYLAVVNPQKKYFFLTSESTGADSVDRRAGADPLISVAEFARMSRLRIDTSRAKAVDWSREWPGGAGRAEPIFSQTGSYEILVGAESIDQEGAPFDFKCRVHYDAEPR